LAETSSNHFLFVFGSARKKVKEKESQRKSRKVKEKGRNKEKKEMDFEGTKASVFPTLTRGNWHSEYRTAFTEFALNCGEAGEIIISGADFQMTPPAEARLEVRVVQDGEGLEVRHERFPNNDRGDRMFERYERQYNLLKDGKKKLIAKLLSTMDKEVKDSLITSAGYDEAYARFDIMTIWNLTEQVVTGRGAISVYSLIVRLLKHKQEGAFTTYAKEFKDMSVDLRAQGDPAVLLTKVLNALFILGLNPDQFKEKLATVYGQREWPEFTQLAAELHTYTEATERMSELRKDNQE